MGLGPRPRTELKKPWQSEEELCVLWPIGFLLSKQDVVRLLHPELKDRTKKIHLKLLYSLVINVIELPTRFSSSQLFPNTRS